MTIDWLAIVVLLVIAVAYAVTAGPKSRRAHHWWRPLFAIVFAILILRISQGVSDFNPWLAVADAIERTGIVDAVRDVLGRFRGEGATQATPNPDETSVARRILDTIWRLVNSTIGVTILFFYLAARFLGSALSLPVPRGLKQSVAEYLTSFTHVFHDGLGYALRTNRFATWMLTGLSWAILGTLYIEFSGTRDAPPWQVTTVLPALLFIVIHEIASFLGGPYLHHEPEPATEPVAPPAPWTANLHALTKTYQSTWPDWVSVTVHWTKPNHAPTAMPDPSRNRRGVARLLRGWRRTPDVAVAEDDGDDAAFTTLLERRLRAGEDVLIVDELPIRLTETLTRHLLRTMWSGHRVVVVVEDEGLIDHTCTTIERLFAGSHIRAVPIDHPDLRHADVLVLTVRQRVNERVKRHVAGHPCLLLVTDANATILWHSHEMRALREELLELSGSLPQVVALADWHVSLEAAMRSAMGFAVRSLRPKPNARPTSVMVWRTDHAPGERFDAPILPNGLHVKTTPEAVLTVPLAEKDATNVLLMMQRRQPQQDVLGSLSNAQDQWLAFRETERLDEGKVHVVPASFDLRPVGEGTDVVIVRDAHADLMTAARKWSSLSDHGTLVHVVSPPYLYRAMLAARLAEAGPTRRSAFSALAPEVDAGSRFQRCYDLFRRLERGWVDVRAIVSDLRFIEDDGHREERIDVRLQRAFATHLDIDHLEKDLEYRDRFGMHAGGDVARVTEMRLGHGRTAPALDWMRPLRIVSPETGAAVLAVEYAGEFYQRYAPLQTYAFDGRKAWRIVRVDLDTATVHTSAVSVDAGGWHEQYRQDRTYRLDAQHARVTEYLHVADPLRFDVEMRLHVVPITVETHGYLAFDATVGVDLNRAVYEPMQSEAKQREWVRHVPHRTYKRGKVLRLRFGPTDMPVDGVAFTLALVVAESLRSYFPHMHPYLAVALTDDARPTATDAFTRRLGMLVHTLVDPIEPQDDAYLDVYLIEDSHFDRGALRAFARHFLHAVVPDLLEALRLDGSNEFLRFGQSNLHPHLRLDEVRAFLSNLQVPGARDGRPAGEPEVDRSRDEGDGVRDEGEPDASGTLDASDGNPDVPHRPMVDPAPDVGSPQAGDGEIVAVRDGGRAEDDDAVVDASSASPPEVALEWTEGGDLTENDPTELDAHDAGGAQDDAVEQAWRVREGRAVSEGGGGASDARDQEDEGSEPEQVIVDSLQPLADHVPEPSGGDDGAVSAEEPGASEMEASREEAAANDASHESGEEHDDDRSTSDGKGGDDAKPER